MKLHVRQSLGDCVHYGDPLFYVGLFNMRGSDIDYNPLFFSYAIITLEDVR